MRKVLVAALAALTFGFVGASASDVNVTKVETVKKVVEHNATDADRMFTTAKEKKVFSADKNATKNKTMWQKFTGWLGEKKQKVKDANLTAKTKAAIEKAKEKAAAATEVAAAKAREVAKAAVEKAKKAKEAAVKVANETKEGITDAYHQYKEKNKQKEEVKQK